MIDFFIYPLIFVFGLSAGSFLNCVIYRLNSGENFLLSRSYCPNCRHQLNWQDLVPFFSFLILRGRCRYCQKPISLQYPLVELAAAFLFVLALNFELGGRNYGFFDFNVLPDLLFLITIFSLLIIIFVYDLKHYIIPDKIIYPAIIVAFFYQLLGIWNFGHWNLFRISPQPQIWGWTTQPIENGLWSDLGFGILPSLFLLTIILFSRGRWMGFGDFKLAIFMGLFLGWPNILVALFFAFFSGAIIGIGLILAGQKTLKSEVPFGPFLVAGTFAAFFLGDGIISWYLNLFL